MGKNKKKKKDKEPYDYEDGLTKEDRRHKWTVDEWERILKYGESKCRTEAWKIAEWRMARLCMDLGAGDLKLEDRSSYICYDRKCCDGQKNVAAVQTPTCETVDTKSTGMKNDEKDETNEQKQASKYEKD